MVTSSWGGPTVTSGYAYSKLPPADSITSSLTPTPTIKAAWGNDFIITALAGDPTFAAPTGAKQVGAILGICIYDDGTQRNLSWNAVYVDGANVAKPTTTVVGKWLVVAFRWDGTNWVCLGNN